MSASHERLLRGYFSPKIYELFKAWKPYDGDSEKLNVIVEHFFKTMVSDKDQLRILADYRKKRQ